MIIYLVVYHNYETIDLVACYAAEKFAKSLVTKRNKKWAWLNNEKYRGDGPYLVQPHKLIGAK